MNPKICLQLSDLKHNSKHLHLPTYQRPSEYQTNIRQYSFNFPKVTKVANTFPHLNLTFKSLILAMQSINLKNIRSQLTFNPQTKHPLPTQVQQSNQSVHPLFRQPKITISKFAEKKIITLRRKTCRSIQQTKQQRNESVNRQCLPMS